VTIVSLLSAASPLRAAAAGLTDLSSHAPPSVARPAAGASYVDPVFGTTITRITDASLGTLCVNAYSYWPAFNADDTRLMVGCDDVPYLYRFDAQTRAVTADGKLWGADGAKVQFEGAYWSNTDPNVVYGIEGTRLWRIDVTQRGSAGYTLVHDFAGLFSYSYYLAQLQMSGDDNVFTFHTRDSSGAKLDVVAYDRAANSAAVFPRGAWTIDESKVDPSGGRILIDGGSANPGLKIWSWRSGAVDAFAWQDANDKIGGHEDVGATQFVNGDGWNTGILIRTYASPHGATNLKNIVQYTRTNGTLNWTLADHISFREQSGTFVVASTYGGDGTWQPFEKEIYLAYSDGSGFVRLAHTRSAGASGNAGFDYYAEPRAVVDRFGRYVVFTSDFGSSTRTDAFLLEIPSALWPATSGGGSTGGADGGSATGGGSTDGADGGIVGPGPHGGGGTDDSGSNSGGATGGGGANGATGAGVNGGCSAAGGSFAVQGDGGSGTGAALAASALLLIAALIRRRTS
jgi:hypothetical protein